MSAFSPYALGGLRLRNRLVKAATFEGMGRGGRATPALTAHHRAIAAGGAAMTTVAYCSVSPEGRTYDTQLLLDDAGDPELRRLTDAVHAEGAAAALQLGHSGYFADRRVIGQAPLGASRVFNTYGLSWPRVMDEAELARVVGDFATAAERARAAGFDAVELHFGHGYLVSQFLSPFTNRRRDRWGGALENRARLGLEILRAVRARVPADFPVMAKINLRDGFAGGLELDEAMAAARLFADEGASALVLSGGFVSKAPLYMLRGDVPVAQMAAAQPRWWARLGLQLFGRLLVQHYPYAENFFLDDARRMRAAVRVPLMLLGGVRSRAGIERALAEGFELVGMGRALLHDAALPRKLAAGELAASGCEPCNECIVEMDKGGVRCVRVPPQREVSGEIAPEVP